MHYVLGGLLILIINVVVNGIITALKIPKSVPSGIVILPKLILIIGVICSSAFMIPATIILLSGQSIHLSIIFIAFSLLGASLIVAFFNCRIMYDDKYIIYKNFFGIKKRFSYDEIRGISGQDKNIKLDMGKHTVRIDELAFGRKEFLTFAKKKYRMSHDGTAIPTSTRFAKKDIFHGHVENPGEFIFTYCLIGVLLFGMLIFYPIASLPKSADNLKYQTISFEKYEVHKDELRLYSTSHSEYYSIPAYKKLLTNPEKFLTTCNNRERIEVGAIHYDKADEPYYDLESIIGNDGNVYLTPETVSKHNRSNMLAVELIFFSMALIWAVLVVLSIRIGRHPEKYSKKIIRLFFKDGYVH